MVDIDYIIVGGGIAGLSLCEQLRQRDKSFLLFDTGELTATAVAGGVVNPIVVKRLNPVWRAREFITYARPFYEEMSQTSAVDFVQDLDLARPFAEVSEQNNWMTASDRPDLEEFVDGRLMSNENAAIKADHGLGKVKGCFRLDPPTLMQGYRQWLNEQGRLRKESFDYQRLKQRATKWQYEDLLTSRVIFAEGAQGVDNPFFKSDSLIPKKGEYLIVEAPGLNLEMMLKGRFFVIPLGRDRYQVGATFTHGDVSLLATEKGREQMEDFLKHFLKVDFKVVDQLVGLRPTVKDRRPLIGAHPKLDGLAFFNGMGTRGLLMAPLLSQWMIDHLEEGLELPEEISLMR